MDNPCDRCISFECEDGKRCYLWEEYDRKRNEEINMMTTPRPSEPTPVQSQKFNQVKLFVNGKEYPCISQIKYGTVDLEKGKVTYYEHKENEE